METGRFPTAKFRDLAHTAWDMNTRVFMCHKSSDDQPVACAGFLERGADHNMTVRLAYGRDRLEKKDRSGGRPLYASYREMAEANGVGSDDPILEPCREPDGKNETAEGKRTNGV